VNPSHQQFEALVAPHFDALYRAAFRLTRSRDDAEDLVQEVCLKALRDLSTLAGLESAAGWLMRVQYRIFIDGDRRRRRSPVSFSEAASDLAERRVSESPGPDELTDGRLQRQRLTEAWACLNAEQRALLGLHAEGYVLSELEQLTGMPRSVLSARLHRARRRLSKLLFDAAETAAPLRIGVTGK